MFVKGVDQPLGDFAAEQQKSCQRHFSYARFKGGSVPLAQIG